MVRRWTSLLFIAAITVALLGLPACHKKEASTPEEAQAVEKPAAPQEGQATETEETAEQPAEAEETGPPPTPEPKGQVIYPAGEEPVLIAGAHISEQVREQGHWHVAYTVDAAPQRIISFYRQQAATRGWTEKSFQAMGPGGFINWKTAHGELQMIVGRSPARGSTVDLNWNQAQ